ncbi:hypothetical protein DRN32_06800 [Thermococci archaeon]|nr:MAG: hypothetical protein DRN32_06800 [Thermococci archaeon]
MRRVIEVPSWRTIRVLILVLGLLLILASFYSTKNKIPLLYYGIVAIASVAFSILINFIKRTRVGYTK